MAKNNLCKKVDWDDDAEKQEAWANARTGSFLSPLPNNVGYPWIDAIMTQLKTEGWIHHLARHCVACFLTRGDLYQSWEYGAKIFERHLLDGDWSLNVSNWLWLSCSCFFQTYWRVYSPVAFPKQYPGAIKYIRHYLPVLKVYIPKIRAHVEGYAGSIHPGTLEGTEESSRNRKMHRRCRLP